MDSILSINIKGINYLCALSVVQIYPELFKEGKTRPRKIIEYKNMPVGSYIVVIKLKY
jgi:hypothetical protein